MRATDLIRTVPGCQSQRAEAAPGRGPEAGRTETQSVFARPDDVPPDDVPVAGADHFVLLDLFSGPPLVHFTEFSSQSSQPCLIPCFGTRTNALVLSEVARILHSALAGEIRTEMRQ